MKLAEAFVGDKHLTIEVYFNAFVIWYKIRLDQEVETFGFGDYGWWNQPILQEFFYWFNFVEARVKNLIASREKQVLKETK